jgi:hypothetical protein
VKEGRKAEHRQLELRAERAQMDEAAGRRRGEEIDV